MELILKIALIAPPLLLAITLHEVAHGWTARYFGDPTASELGRLSLNPFKHIDPMGTIVVPIMLYLTSGFLIGWAKAVPVNMRKLSSPKRDMALVAAAGPGSNFVMALLWAIAARFALLLNYDFFTPLLLSMATVGIFINLILMVLNLIPFPPLDGSKVLSGVLPDQLSIYMYKLERYGIFIFLGIVLLDLNMGLGIFSTLVLEPTNQLFNSITQLFGLSSI